jgi:hypothetical protein
MPRDLVFGQFSWRRGAPWRELLLLAAGAALFWLPRRKD